MSPKTVQKTTAPDLSLERLHNHPVCGVDEAGRAPLAGPVVAACVYIPPEKQTIDFWSSVNDSKKLTPQKRAQLFILLREHTAHGIAQASPEEIDTLNIHHAALLAMKRACLAMMDTFGVRPEMALIDGKFAPLLPFRTQTVIKGDGKSLSIAAASILAKVTRDRLMSGLHTEHPVYGWDRNAGYPTPEHQEAIRRHGITKYHRLSFAPCRQSNLP